MASKRTVRGKVVIAPNQVARDTPTNRTYRGISTVNRDSGSFSLYDFELIKQDLLNHLHIRQGEKLENPEFGTIIWDLIFEPLTTELTELIAQNVTDIVNFDPRVKVDRLMVSKYESGIQVDCELTYVKQNISEALRFRFDQNNTIS